MFYNDNLYPSSRHLLLANPELVAGGDIEKMVASLNQKVRRTKAKGETLGLSLDEVSARFGVDKLRYVDVLLLLSDELKCKYAYPSDVFVLKTVL